MYTVAQFAPQIWSLATETAANLTAGKYSSWDDLTRPLDRLVRPELIEETDTSIPGWKKIATIDDGLTAKHTLLVLVCCVCLPEYQQASQQTQHEIEWAALLHDLDKNKTRGDTAHPFRSAEVVARIMPQLGFAVRAGLPADYLESWSGLVMASQRADGDRMVHDHSYLPQIIEGLHHCWGHTTPAARILKAVLLHQSLPTLKEWGNAVLLTDEEISCALSLEDMEILGPLMIGDSDSWNIFNDTRSAYLAEIRASNAETRHRIARAPHK